MKKISTINKPTCNTRADRSIRRIDSSNRSVPGGPTRRSERAKAAATNAAVQTSLKTNCRN